MDKIATCQNGVTLYEIPVGKTQELTIIASDEYSCSRITVNVGEEYEIWCDSNQRWKDSFLPSTTPDGFFNILASIAGKRVSKTKCFCLCGVYDLNDSTGFAIGSDKTFTIPPGCSELSFFPNDTKGFHENNSGSITINVRRLM